MRTIEKVFYVAGVMCMAMGMGVRLVAGIAERKIEKKAIRRAEERKRQPLLRRLLP